MKRLLEVLLLLLLLLIGTAGVVQLATWLSELMEAL